MPLEIIQWQAQQPAEQMQIELGVEPRADDGNNGAPGILDRRCLRQHRAQDHHAMTRRKSSFAALVCAAPNFCELEPWSDARCVLGARLAPDIHTYLVVGSQKIHRNFFSVQRRVRNCATSDLRGVSLAHPAATAADSSYPRSLVQRI